MRRRRSRGCLGGGGSRGEVSCSPIRQLALCDHCTPPTAADLLGFYKNKIGSFAKPGNKLFGFNQAQELGLLQSGLLEQAKQTPISCLLLGAAYIV